MTAEQALEMERAFEAAKFESVTGRFRALVAAGSKDFPLYHLDSYPVATSQGATEDWMYFSLLTRMGKDQPFFNGYDATIIKDVPTHWQKDGLNLKDLQLRLENPPDPLLGRSAAPGEFEKVNQAYYNDLQADLIKLYNNDQTLFYKVVAAYMPIIDPILAPDQRPIIQDKIADGVEGQIRHQRFYTGDGINREEAYNLMDSTRYPRAVYKVFQKRNPADGEGPTAATSEVEVYGKWLKLDYNVAADKYGNRQFKDFGDNYGFDLTQVVQRFAIVIRDQAHLEYIVGQLQQGFKVAVEPVNQAALSSAMKIDNPTEPLQLYLSANPEFKTLTLQDITGKVLQHGEYLTDAARQQRAPRPSEEERFTVQGRGQQREQGPADQKKSFPEPERRMSNDPNRGQGHSL